MSLDVHITDPSTDIKAEVDKSGSLKIIETIPDILPKGTINQYKYFNQYIGDAGFQPELTYDGQIANMNVDGSVTAQNFYGDSSEDYDIYIHGLVVVLADTNVSHMRFGDIPVLNTGWDLKILEDGEITYIINKAKTGGQIITQSGFSRAYGNNTTSFEITEWVEGPPTEEALTVWVSIIDYLPKGFRIGRGSQSRLVSTINDDLTGLTLFSVRVFGYRHYPKKREA